MSKMSDITSALQMEEEALEKMKRSKSERKEYSNKLSGIFNPNCIVTQESDKPSPSTPQTNSAVPDLMSFSDVSAASNSDWSIFESETVTENKKSAYNQSISNVMSLYNTNSRSSSKSLHLPQQHRSYQASSAFTYNWPTTMSFQNNNNASLKVPLSAKSSAPYNLQSSSLYSQQHSPEHHRAHQSSNDNLPKMSMSTDSSNLTLFSSQISSSLNYQPTVSSAPSGNVEFDNFQPKKPVQNPFHSNFATKSTFDDQFSEQRFPRPMSFSHLQEAMFNSSVHNKSSSMQMQNSKFSRNERESAIKVGDKGMFRSSSAGSNLTSLENTEANNDKLTSVFDEWLEGGWSTNSRDASPQHVNKYGVENTPNWLEWDPLSLPAEGSSTKDSFAANKTDAPDLGLRGGFSADKNESEKLRSPTLQLNQNEKNCMDDSVEIDESTELQRFARMIKQLRSKFDHVDNLCNPGHVIGLMTDCSRPFSQNTDPISNVEADATVRISVTTEEISQPFTFECDVNASVDHIVSQALCIAYEDISCVSTDDFYFKIVGRQEYLVSKSCLSLYQYVRECRKFEQDVRLELLHKSKVDRSLSRTCDDDAKTTVASDFLELLGKPPGLVCRDDIQILLEAYYKESEKLLDEIKKELASTNSTIYNQFERVVQTVKATCSSLGNIDTFEIQEEIQQLRSMFTRPLSFNGRSSELIASEVKPIPDRLSTRFNRAREGLESLTSALLDLTQLYCKAHQVDAYFHFNSSNSSGYSLPRIVSTSVKELYSVNIVSIQRLPAQWESMYEEFYVMCSLWHGGRRISHSKSSTRPRKITKHFHRKVLWNSWIEFDVAVGELPLEVTLRLVLHGTITSDEKITSKRLAWLNTPLFNHQRIMKHKNELYGMWDFSKTISKSESLDTCLTCADDISNPDSVVVRIAFSEDKQPTMVVEHSRSASEQSETSSLKWQSMHDLDQTTRSELKSALSHAKLIAGPLFNLSQRERDLLWKHRLVVAAPRDDGKPAIGLPVLLQCVPRWSPTLPHLQDAYDLLAAWPHQLEPEESLVLLTSSFPDSKIRSSAIGWLEMAGDMEIASWLPQLVQAVRFEQRLDSPLTRLFLRRALGSVRICHKLYWLLNENMFDDVCCQQYSALHAALQTICGSAMKKELEREMYFLRMINRVAESVRDAKDSLKASVLKDDLSKVVARVAGHKFRIPTNPALLTVGVNVKNSSYFTSNAVPLKLSFINADGSEGDLPIMYKVGDDLRQDALTMQLIKVMDRMWLSEGLDLRIVTFECLPTGPNKGMVEIISDSKTFREIQSSYGLTGAFKDRPIAEWLQKYNATGLSYERAVENFTLSCAGYCVATYVLGICDRHNDNIMLRNTGHLFHIDFARFLGHAQMFGNIKRDRAPFVLTSDMAYVINGGDRPSSKFQDFVDVCCRAFNILRKQSHTIINLLSLMLNCGIPELRSKSDLKFVYDTLNPNASDTEATTMFTRLIDASLSSSFTRLNFFIHNLAQMRFHGNESEEEKKILSFSPQLHGYKEEEGVIASASVVGYQKRYSPEKYYIYCVKVNRERNTTSIDSYVFRTFDEFEELHRKLSYNSSLTLPNFPSSVVVGRSQVKQVAERRKAKLSAYLSQLLKSSRNVAMHDLVYTFFHPILRDEEQEMSANPKTPDVTVGGEIKVSIHYKNNALYIMINHCKNLSPVNGTDPDPYVKTYLLPDPTHFTKRKTKVARKTLHPTYNEMLVYGLPLDEVKARKLYIGVWNYENLQENDFMGNVVIDLATVDLATETSRWYHLKPAAL